MTYQLPRVMHWFQQATLEHFPTSNNRQLAYAPGAAYWQVQLFALFNGDRGANVPQWAAFLGCALALPVWLRRFFNRDEIGLAVIAGLTMPMVLLQASSTQTDLQVGCWILLATIFFSDANATKREVAAFAGLAIGLAIITKTSAALYAAPLAAAALWRIVATRGLSCGLRTGVIWVVVSLLVCLPHFSRNVRWFGSALGDDHGTIVEAVSPGLAVANTVRWLALNLPALSIWEGIAWTLDSAGVDPNERAITFPDSKFSPASRYVVYRLLLPDEDFASYATALLLVMVLPFGRSLWRGVPRKDKYILPRRPWALALLAMYLLHCIILKWQVWGNRLLLPLALLAFPFLIAKTGVGRSIPTRNVLCSLLLIQAMFVLTFSLNRPLVSLPEGWRFTGAVPLFSASRDTHFFAGYNAETAPMIEQLLAAVRDRNWRRVGLSVDPNYPEYPLWKALRDAGYDNVQLHHVDAAPPAHHRMAWPPQIDGEIRVSPPEAVRP